MKIQKRLISVLLIACMLVTCIPQYAWADATNPVVVSSNPGNDPSAYNSQVDINIVPTITFSKDMDGSSNGVCNGYAAMMYQVGSSSNLITGRSYDAATRTLTLTPSAPLTAGKAYIIYLSSYYCKDLSGNSLIGNTENDQYVIYFSTAGAAGDIIPPVITASNPVSNATGVAVDVEAEVTFNEAMDANTINGSSLLIEEEINSYTFMPVASNVTYDAVSNTARIKPGSSLVEYKYYRIHVKNTVKDAAGNSIQYRTIRFRTGTSDNQPPVLVSTNITNNQTEVGVETKFEATFSEALKYDYFSNYVEVKKDGVPVSIANWGIDTRSSTGQKVLYIPGPFSNVKWEKGANYSITIKPGLKDQYDNVSTETYQYSFSTVQADTTPPVIASMTPNIVSSTTDNPAYINDVRPVFEVTFNEKMDEARFAPINQAVGIKYCIKDGTAEHWYFITQPGTSNHGFTTSYDSATNKLTVTSLMDLTEGKKYQLYISARDAQYNSIDKSGYYFIPRLGEPSDDQTPPAVVSSYPVKRDYLNRPTDIPVNMTGTVTFSEPMKESSINSSTVYINYMNSNFERVSVPAAVTYDPATYTATVKPNSNLEQLKEYVLNVRNAQDAAGNVIADWEADFKTAQTDNKGPVIIAVSPAENAVEAPINQRIKVTFDETIMSNTGEIMQNIVVKQNGVVQPANNATGDNGITVSPSNNILYISREYKVDGQTLWSKSSTYEITIKGGLKDQYGNAMGQDKTWSFTTLTADETAPAIKSMTPNLSNDINNPTAGISTAPSFEIVLSEPIHPSSMNTFSGTGIYYYIDNDISYSPYKIKNGNSDGWSINYDESDSNNVKLTITPTIELTSGRLYKLALPLQDLQFNLLQNNAFYFIAGQGNLDTTAPAVESTMPLQGSTDMSIDIKPTVTFTEPVKQASAVQAVGLYEGTSKVDAEVQYNTATRTCTITPAGALKINTTYKITVQDTVEDIAGNKMAQDFESSFTTGASTSPTTPALESIKALTSTSAVTITNGATDIPMEFTLEIMFNKLMDHGTIKQGSSEKIYITANADKTPDLNITTSKITTVNNKTRVLLEGFFGGMNIFLEPNKTYYLIIPNTVKDADGNAIPRQEIAFTTKNVALNKVIKADVDKVVINGGVSIINPVEVSKSPQKITVTTERPLAGMDINEGAVRLWEDNGTAYGKLIITPTVIVGNEVVLDTSNVTFKENVNYKLLIKDYLLDTENVGLDKEYVYYFMPVNKVVDYTQGNVFIKGNNIIKKDKVSTLTVATDVETVNKMDFSIDYDPAQLSAQSVELAEALKLAGISVSIEKENGVETGRISFSMNIAEAVDITDVFHVSFKSLNGERTVVTFSEISYEKGDGIIKYAEGKDLIVVGLTMDLNGDGKVNVLDVSIVTRAIGIDSNSANWAMYVGRDINEDQKIDEQDADIIKAHYGEVVR